VTGAYARTLRFCDDCAPKFEAWKRGEGALPDCRHVDPQGTVAPASWGPGTMGRDTANAAARMRELEWLLAGALARFETMENGGILTVYDAALMAARIRYALHLDHPA
jgi:hypothetical protein